MRILVNCAWALALAAAGIIAAEQDNLNGIDLALPVDRPVSIAGPAVTSPPILSGQLDLRANSDDDNDDDSGDDDETTTTSTAKKTTTSSKTTSTSTKETSTSTKTTSTSTEKTTSTPTTTSTTSTSSTSSSSKSTSSTESTTTTTSSSTESSSTTTSSTSTSSTSTDASTTTTTTDSSSTAAATATTSESSTATTTTDASSSATSASQTTSSTATATTTKAASSTTAAASSSKRLSAGGIAGIVIGIVAAICLVIFGTLRMAWKARQSRAERHGALGDEPYTFEVGTAVGVQPGVTPGVTPRAVRISRASLGATMNLPADTAMPLPQQPPLSRPASFAGQSMQMGEMDPSEASSIRWQQRSSMLQPVQLPARYSMQFQPGMVHEMAAMPSPPPAYGQPYPRRSMASQSPLSPASGAWPVSPAEMGTSMQTGSSGLTPQSPRSPQSPQSPAQSLAQARQMTASPGGTPRSAPMSADNKDTSI